jgi:hypothetical protein
VSPDDSQINFSVRNQRILIENISQPQISKFNEDESDILSYITQIISIGYIPKNNNIGRPRVRVDNSISALTVFFEEYIRELQNLIESEFSKKRSDTFRNTIFSYLKKLPIKLRERSCSVSEPKSKVLRVYLNSFLSPFVE